MRCTHDIAADKIVHHVLLQIASPTCALRDESRIRSLLATEAFISKSVVMHTAGRKLLCQLLRTADVQCAGGFEMLLLLLMQASVMRRAETTSLPRVVMRR